jgi:hypothetical protein
MGWKDQAATAAAPALLAAAPENAAIVVDGKWPGRLTGLGA